MLADRLIKSTSEPRRSSRYRVRQPETHSAPVGHPIPAPRTRPRTGWSHTTTSRRRHPGIRSRRRHPLLVGPPVELRGHHVPADRRHHQPGPFWRRRVLVDAAPGAYDLYFQRTTPELSSELRSIWTMQNLDADSLLLGLPDLSKGPYWSDVWANAWPDLRLITRIDITYGNTTSPDRASSVGSGNVGSISGDRSGSTSPSVSSRVQAHASYPLPSCLTARRPSCGRARHRPTCTPTSMHWSSDFSRFRPTSSCCLSGRPPQFSRLGSHVAGEEPSTSATSRAATEQSSSVMPAPNISP